VKQVKIYPLSKADNPPAQRLLDMTEVMYNGLVKYNETFFTSLARMLNEETVQPRDLQMMGMLLPLGIERSKEFKPDAATVAQLNAAAAEAHAWLMDKAATDVTPWWPDSQWCVPSPPITVPTEFKWETPNYFGVDARAIALSQYFCPTAWAPAVSTSPAFTTGTANRWRARAITGCTFQQMCLCASSGPQPSTV
jgi:hypothetical protein